MLPNHLSVNNWASIILGLLLLNSYALHSQSWQWSDHMGSNQNDICDLIQIDQFGNSYWGGRFRGNFCYFQNDTSYGVTGASDFLLIKYDAAGYLTWWKQFGGNNPSTSGEGFGSMALDDQNNIYITGSFYGTTVFSPFVLSSVGDIDFFLAKFDSSGNCLWAKSAGGTASDFGSGLALDASGYIYLCGTNNETAIFDSFIIPPGGFIAKYDTSGNCIWAKNKMGYVSVPFSGNVCTAAPYSLLFLNSSFTISGYIATDTVNIDSTFIYSKSRYCYQTSFDTSGSLKWISVFAGATVYLPGHEHTNDGIGNVYTTGTSGGQGYFATDTLSGSHVAFLVKHDTLGNEQWVRGVIASGESFGNMVSSNYDGNVYLTGKFSGSASFGNFNVTASTSNDMFVARYNSTGDCLGVRTFGQAEGFGVTQDVNGNAYVCGTFDNTVSIGGNTFTTYGDKDIFIAKLDEIVGVEEINGRTGNQLLIYANPNAGKCNITVPDEFANEQNLTLSIFNLQGQLIQQQPLKMQEGKIKVNLSAEAKGVYNVTLSNGTKMYYGKIIFE